MHKNPIKRILAVVLAMTLIVASLPLLAGRLMKAMALENVTDCTSLVTALNNGATEIKLDNDIELDTAIAIPSSCVIDGNGKTIMVSSSSTNPAIKVLSGTVTLQNVTIMGGSGVVVDNASTSNIIVKNSNIRENSSDSSIINNLGKMVLDCVGINENRIDTAAINNSGALYANNITVAGNVSNNSSIGTGTVVNSGSAYILNSTIAGNKIRGIYSSGRALKIVNDIVEKNIPNGCNESDIVTAANTVDNLLAYSVYGALTANTLVTDNSKQVTDTENIFCDYSNGFPLIYNNVLYLKDTFAIDTDNPSTKVCFDYSDIDNVKISYGPNGTEKNVTDNDASTMVSTYQEGTVRGLLAGSAPISTESYHKITLGSASNGSVTGIGLFGTVVKNGESIELTATPNNGFTFRRFLDSTNSSAKTFLSTNVTYTFTPTEDTIIDAEFGKKVTFNLSLLLDGTAWPSQIVELYQYGVKQGNALTNSGNVYIGTDVYTGTYDVYVNHNDSGQDVNVTGSTTPQSVNYCSLEYLANGADGTSPSKVYAPKNTNVQLVGNGSLTKEDYIFTGWVKPGSTTVLPVGSSLKLTSGTKLYANWASKTIEASAVIKLDGTPNSSFNVIYKNIRADTTYEANKPSSGNMSYTASVPNDNITDSYQVIVNGEVIETTTGSGLPNATYNYSSVTYHGNGNTDDQSDTVKKVLTGSNHLLIANTYTKTGYEFDGWNSQENGGGTTITEGTSVLVNSATNYYAKWTINSYTVTFDVKGGSPLSASDSTRKINYNSVYGTLPTTTKLGYNFVGWEYNNSLVTSTTVMNVASNHTLNAKWKPITYSINVPTGSNLNYTLTPSNGMYTAEYGTDYTFTLTPKEGYSVAHAVVKVKDKDTNLNEQTLALIGGVYTIPSVTCDKTVEVTGISDTLPPTGVIEINTNRWTSLLNTITFGKFFKETQSVKISATDPSGVGSVSYLVANTKISLSTLEGYDVSKWIPIANGGTFSISPDAKLIVYAKLVDTDGHTSFISSDGLVLDQTAPVIAGVTDGQTYTGAQTVKVTDEYLALVTVDDVAVIPDEDDNITVTGKPGAQTIVAKDMAGNVTSVTITVNRDLSVDDGNVTKQVDVLSSAPDTMITQTKEELKNMLLTDDDLEAVDAGEDINLLVKVRGEDVVPQDDKDLIEEEMSDKKIINIFDISVFKEYLTRNTSEKLTTTNEELTFIFDIPDEYLDVPEGKTRTFYLGRVHDDVLEYLDDKDAEVSKYTADSDKFSTYVLAYKDAEGTTATTATADTSTTTAVPTTNENATSTTAVPSEAESTTSNGTTSGGAGILTEDNAPILISALGVMVAGIAIVVIDKKRKESRKHKESEE